MVPTGALIERGEPWLNSFANTLKRSKTGTRATSCASTGRRELTAHGRGGSSFIRLTRASQCCVQRKRRPSLTTRDRVLGVWARAELSRRGARPRTREFASTIERKLLTPRSMEFLFGRVRCGPSVLHGSARHPYTRHHGSSILAGTNVELAS